MKLRPKWKRREQGQFLLHIGQLLDQGYTLGDAIELVGIHQKREAKENVYEIIESLRKGTAIHQILLEYQFPKNVAGYLYFAEQHGNLSFAFKESGKLMIKQNELGKEFMKLTRYPLFLCLVTSVIFFFILRRLIPQFQSLYTSLDIELPLITKLFLKFLHFSPILLLYFTCLVVILAFTFIKKVKRFTPLEKMTFYLKIPVLKSILSILITHYFAIQLSYLLRGGLSIFDSLTLFEQQSYFKFFQQEAVWMKKNLREGDSFPSLLENNSLFTPELCRVVSHGLSNGQLEKDLSDYSSFLFIAFEEKFKFYFSIIQPVLFSLIGVIIFIMFISILLPMFHLLNSL